MLVIAIEKDIEQHLDCKIQDFRPASGGCINHGGELITNQGSFFVKWNDASRYPGMFTAEAKGLRLLHEKNCIEVPHPIVVKEIEGSQYILMTFIRSTKPGADYWKALGGQLANLHKHTQDNFGLSHDNYIGSHTQHNTVTSNWIDFFITQRLEKQILLAEKNNSINISLRKKFETLHKKLPNLLPEEKPALLHGDLWSGNVMVNGAGKPALIDPAVYYGHREAELAFTQLFGGFDPMFYESYFSSFPVEPGFDTRVDVYNLYPLLVHVNLFGGGYLQQVIDILNRFT
ncbi:MAG: fructosamine kinase family protein [Cyclobacteriaceae bacterium]|nr:fructosamine kinase family protein [Cyclobacteriaceae bacterium]